MLRQNEIDYQREKYIGNEGTFLDSGLKNEKKNILIKQTYEERSFSYGVYQDEESDQNTIDKDIWLHISNMDKLDKKENFTITEKIKELIITVKSANMRLIFIENEVQKRRLQQLVSYCMTIGDKTKYFTILLTLKHHIKLNGTLLFNGYQNLLNMDVIQVLKQLDSKATKIPPIPITNKINRQCKYQN
ncbi:unnamed protein product [Paramecium octaurelia]|uniref:Uncharacterized protein n=1 Tax=Paramecium octaurelia TaxID=43137 RepID=A0A8S1UUL0_PAROT|nr:unnamed protein product [Paramecium octaurelia]